MKFSVLFKRRADSRLSFGHILSGASEMPCPRWLFAPHRPSPHNLMRGWNPPPLALGVPKRRDEIRMAALRGREEYEPEGRIRVRGVHGWRLLSVRRSSFRRPWRQSEGVAAYKHGIVRIDV
jgi:hypothetical protein